MPEKTVTLKLDLSPARLSKFQEERREKERAHFETVGEHTKRGPEQLPTVLLSTEWCDDPTALNGVGYYRVIATTADGQRAEVDWVSKIDWSSDVQNDPQLPVLRVSVLLKPGGKIG